MATLADLGLTEAQVAARYDCSLLLPWLAQHKCPWCSWQVGSPLVGLTPQGAPVLQAAWAQHAWSTHGPRFLGFVDAFAEQVFRCASEAASFADQWGDMDRLRREVSV